jgi:hypothetical protein
MLNYFNLHYTFNSVLYYNNFSLWNKKMSNYNLDFKVTKEYDDIRITLLHNGDGHDGKYNKEDEHDTPFLRFIIEKKQNNKWEKVPNSSHRIDLDCAISDDDAIRALDLIASNVKEAILSGNYIDTCKKQSYIYDDDVRAIVKFQDTTIENKVFIQKVAKLELNIDFSIEELDILLEDETDKFISTPLIVYNSDPDYVVNRNTLDTFDRCLIRDTIWTRIIGVNPELYSEEELKEYITDYPDWINNLFSIEEVISHIKNRKEVTERLIIGTGKFRDYLVFKTDEKYSQVFLDFLLENKEEVRKRLKAVS